MVESAQIEGIVREVLRRLAADAAPAAAPAPVPLPSPAAPPAPPRPVEVGELRITERVVSRATLDGRLAGVRRVVVPARAVLTPAARDLLNKVGVELIRATCTTASAKAAGTLYIHYTDQGGPSASLVAPLPRDSWAVESLVACPLPQAVSELAAVLASASRLGVLFTKDADAAVCLANRRSSLRALLGAEPAAVQTAVRAIGANLLVINPQRTSPLAARNLIRQFVADGPRGCPPHWAEHLSE